MKHPNQYHPVRIGAAPFTIRTLHGPDRRRATCCDDDLEREHTLDQTVTITLPAIGRKATKELWI